MVGLWVSGFEAEPTLLEPPRRRGKDGASRHGAGLFSSKFRIVGAGFSLDSVGVVFHRTGVFFGICSLYILASEKILSILEKSC